MHTLGVAELQAKKFDDALAHVRRGLAIRERNTPQGSVQVAESLQGVGDVLSTSGHDPEAIPYFERALAVLEQARESDSMFAANVHLLLGISLETVKRSDDAITHYLRSADISDRSLVHKESHAATALHLAADVEGARGHIATGVTYLERALGLHERGKSSPVERAMTQHRLAVFLVTMKPPETQRARALAEAARAGFVVGGDRYKPNIAELDKFLADH